MKPESKASSLVRLRGQRNGESYFTLATYFNSHSFSASSHVRDLAPSFPSCCDSRLKIQHFVLWTRCACSHYQDPGFDSFVTEQATGPFLRKHLDSRTHTPAYEPLHHSSSSIPTFHVGGLLACSRQAKKGQLATKCHVDTGPGRDFPCLVVVRLSDPSQQS